MDWPLRPPDFPLGDEPNPTDNVLYGVTQCEKIPSDATSTPELKAVYLSYLIHLAREFRSESGWHAERCEESSRGSGQKGRASLSRISSRLAVAIRLSLAKGAGFS